MAETQGAQHPAGDRPAKGLERRAVGGLVWMLSGVGFQAVLRLLLLLVLARLIGPEAFGIVGAALVVVHIALVFSNLGISSAIVQRAELQDRHIHSAFALALLSGALITLVVELLAQWGQSDNLLLRLALAARRLGLAEAQKHEQALGERFAAAALRGERLHLAEEARFRLELKGDAKGALAAAAENWNSQREPRDAAVLLAAARAAGDPPAAAPGLRGLEESGFESAQLRRLAAQLK